jgi:hypothetical protein
MPREALTIGPAHTLVEDVIYALPTPKVTIHSDTALEVDVDITFSSSQTVNANTPTVVAGGFVRCTTGDATVFLKRD